MLILSNFAERLDELLFDNKFSVSDLSKKLNLDTSTIYKYLNAKKLPSVETAIKLANLFNCSIEYLLAKTEAHQEQVFYNPPLFCEHLKFLLNHFNKTQYNLVKYGKFSQSALQHWLKGTFIPSLDNIEKLARFFDCSMDFILGREK